MSFVLGALLSLCTGAVLSLASPPAPAPAAAPATRPAPDDAQTASIRKLFANLADSDATVRDAARDSLMGLSDADLPTLKRIVQQDLPLQPSQRAALRDIVTQIFLASRPPDGDAQRGFMGVEFDKDQQISGEDGPDGALGGVEVRHRIPGFCAFRRLRDGDIIQEVVSQPPVLIRSPQDIINTVPRYRAGEVVVFEVLREGKQIRVPIRLDAHPNPSGMEGLNPLEIEMHIKELLQDRQKTADDYWEREFEPLLGGNDL